jgi:hypothetical protein
MAAWLFVQAVVLLTVIAWFADMSILFMAGFGAAMGAIQVALCYYIGKSGAYPPGW